MDNSDIKILVVDDEADIRKIVRLLLQKNGYTVFEAANGVLALEAVSSQHFDLIIMDIMMPRMSGVEAAAEIRRVSTAPILFLTAKSLESDRESAYMSGGDDYIVKPFSASELILRVTALLRRYMIYKGKTEKEDIISLPCGIEVDTERRTIMKHGEEISLRDKESDIFFFLLSHRGETLEANEIYEAVWHEKALSSSANNVMVNMLGLRKKLEDDPSNPRLIRTVWGRGYQLG